MTPYDKLKTVRKSDRPTSNAFIERIFTDRIDLHGDRRFGDDSAITAGIGFINNLPVTYIAIEKGTDIAERLKNNFGCPKPEGYRKALRLMKQAEKFHRPVVCFVDTLGAFCGADGEERGQGQAIAENILEMSGLKVPVVSVIIGEGGSGGALALCTADKVYMLENAVYSVISPDGCASILWKDSSRVADASDCLRITAEDMVEFGVAEDIFDENFSSMNKMCTAMKKSIYKDLMELSSLPTSRLLENRYERFRKFGVYRESGRLK